MSGDRTYRTIEELRAALYPNSARLLRLDPEAIIQWPPAAPAPGPAGIPGEAE